MRWLDVKGGGDSATDRIVRNEAISDHPIEYGKGLFGQQHESVQTR